MGFGGRPPDRWREFGERNDFPGKLLTGINWPLESGFCTENKQRTDEEKGNMLHLLTYVCAHTQENSILTLNGQEQEGQDILKRH